MKSVDIKELLDLLEEILEDPVNRDRNIEKYELAIGNFEIKGGNQEQRDFLECLVHDFSYYSNNKAHLAQEPSLINYSELERRILGAVDKVKSSQDK